ncbi:unnamed protein product [Spirodela intermedia]|uniref:Uncharacterized protein n=2 Tax=Spirodela intermedia TaxID=51605 RepID=A0A7I8KFY2_SPIIN|nr:unnamed protein product [Spirodela intermedia]CAA6659655.1 unnamed protein product [Spirodela intermedia]CAA7395988.1 unnamed protein product [Spirodela intermedia]
MNHIFHTKSFSLSSNQFVSCYIFFT